MNAVQRLDNERGIALITVLLVALVVGVFSVAAALIGTNSGLINRYQERQNTLSAVADAGIEEARSLVNADLTLYPANGYATLEAGVAVTDAQGNPIPGVQRSLYVGPTGITSGQYGVFGSVVSVAEDQYGNRVVRRGEMVQQSFARYAYFTTFEPATIQFGGGDQIWGPVHSNSPIRLYNTPPNPSATFWGPVTTAQDVQNGAAGLFAQGFREFVDAIPMPTTADLNALAIQAQTGNTYFVGNTTGAAGGATTRIDFVAIDLDPQDGQVNGANEGFIRVYQCNNMANATCANEWVAAKRPATITDSRVCGDYHGANFVVADDHPFGGHNSTQSLQSGTRRCYLGGSEELFDGVFTPNDGTGTWRTWPGAVSALVAARQDGAYLFPITRALNPNFKGVIFVQGDVVISGVVRGRVTVAATGNIVIGDDITLATDPGAGTCGDMLGLFAGVNVVVSDNSINAPINVTGYRTYDDTRDEFVQAVVLALNIFTVENFDLGAQNAEACQGVAWGRGCLFLTGGLIQFQRGAVGTTNGTGNLKRYAYNQCGLTNPPPYFPTTGVFDRGRYYEVNPVGFDVAALYTLLTPP
jgi:hypothetical protein